MGLTPDADTLARRAIEGHGRKAPEIVLAQHVNEAFGTRISAEDLKRFLTENWWTVQRLAHQIHDAKTEEGRALARRSILYGGM